MDNYPQNIVEQYLKTSNKLKKIDRVILKRFAPNVSEVLDEFARLAITFEEAAIYPYAAMCHMGVAKCELLFGNVVSEYNAYLKAARAFIRANNTSESLHLRSNRREYIEGALRCYTLAMAHCPDDSIMKATIIREMTPLQPNYEGTSSFSSPAHRIYELELAAHRYMRNRDFLAALQELDDIVDNIYERKKHTLYVDLLRRIEILRVLLLVVLNLPPARQSPSHIKVIDFYYAIGHFQDKRESMGAASSPPLQCDSYIPGSYITLRMQIALAEIIVAWCEYKQCNLKFAAQEFAAKFKSLHDAHRFIIDCICENVDKNC